MLSTVIATETLARLDFANDDLEAKFEVQNSAYVALVETGKKFEDAAAAAGLDVEDATGKSILGLAFAFGKTYKDLDEDQQVEIRDAFGKIYQGQSEELDAAGQELFDATLAYFAATVDLNTYVNDNIAEPTEPVEP